MFQWINPMQCTGCSACAAICPSACIQVKVDKNGFYIPIIDSKGCIQCHKCENTCPVIHSTNQKQEDTMAFAAISKHDLIRSESSSGGVFSELANYVLDNGGCVFGAAFTKDFRVKHICVENKQQLNRLRGAKYAQSWMGNCFSEVEKRLRSKQIVLFSGLPCQIAGLQSYLKKRYENLITVDFICHGVPSSGVWKQYVSYRTQKDNNGKLPQYIKLRCKSTGWSRYQYSVEFYYTDGKKYSCINTKDPFMKLFVGDYINRQSCANCRFKGFHRTSDITLGDFWGVWDYYPDMDDNKGTSILLIHSIRGMRIFSFIQKNLRYKSVQLDEVSAQNRSVLTSSPSNAKRDVIIQKSLEGNFEEIMMYLERNIPMKPSILHRIWNKIHNK